MKVANDKDFCSNFDRVCNVDISNSNVEILDSNVEKSSPHALSIACHYSKYATSMESSRTVFSSAKQRSASVADAPSCIFGGTLACTNVIL